MKRLLFGLGEAMYSKKATLRVCQGDIFEDFVYNFTRNYDQSGQIIALTLPYAVVLSQDCDLEWDYEKRGTSQSERITISDDKTLQSILICPAYLAEQFRSGVHLESLGLKMQSWNTDLWKNIKKNQNERFHFLEEDLDNGIPELVIDFKHFYTIPIEDIYSLVSTSCKITINALFREDLSRRFANYLSRIGLPNISTPAPEKPNTSTA